MEPRDDLTPTNARQVQAAASSRNVALFPWYKFFSGLIFWQAVWFLYFQNQLSAAAAILLYAAYDIATMVLEVPSGWMSDRFGRRPTLIVAAMAGLAGAALLVIGGSFGVFLAGQILIGAAMAFSSGTDSALLYESLAINSEEDAIEWHEMRAWRFSFAALAFSAVTGGAMSLVAPIVPFIAGCLAASALLAITWSLTEPSHVQRDPQEIRETERIRVLGKTMRDPALVWLFMLSIAMYGFSHVPFVFGQPFILQALTAIDLDAQAPLVSGAVSSGMMLLSVTVSLAAPELRDRVGLAGILLIAFAVQIVVIGALSLTDAAFAIAILLMRMVPDSLSRPFVVARIQRSLDDVARATYLSVQSLVGRLVFAASLSLAAFWTADRAEMSGDQISVVLTWYAGAGLVVWIILAIALRSVPLELRQSETGSSQPR